MAYELDDTWLVVSKQVTLLSTQLVELLQKAEEKYQDILAAYVSAGNTDIAYARVLYQLPSTEKTRFRVDATLKTITHVDAAGVKLAGSGIFADFTVGADLKTVSFANAGNNNSSMLLTEKIDNETLKFNDHVGFVSEVGSGDERISQQASTDQTDAITVLMATVEDHHELYGALTNQITATADRLAQLRKMI